METATKIGLGLAALASAAFAAYKFGVFESKDEVVQVGNGFDQYGYGYTSDPGYQGGVSPPSGSGFGPGLEQVMPSGNTVSTPNLTTVTVHDNLARPNHWEFKADIPQNNQTPTPHRTATILTTEAAASSNWDFGG